LNFTESFGANIIWTRILANRSRSHCKKCLHTGWLRKSATHSFVFYCCR